MTAQEKLANKLRNLLEKVYNRINWKNLPAMTTALGATNLNRMDVAINTLDNRVIQLDAEKLGIDVANLMVSSWVMDMNTYIITVTQLDGTIKTYDLNLERIPIETSLSEDGILTFTYADDSQDSVNIADLIKDTVYDDSDTIGFSKTFVKDESNPDDKGIYHVTAIVKNGSIKAQHLDPDYRADIQAYTNTAQTAASDALTYAKDSKRWAIGDNTYPGSETDSSKYYKEQAELAKTAAEKARDEAQAATGAQIATTETVGVVKPDGLTITIEEDGTIHGSQKVDMDGYVYVDSEQVTGTAGEPTLDADKLGGQRPEYYATQNELSDAFSEAKTYAVGDYTIYGNALYKYTQAKETGPWDGSLVIPITVTGEIKNLSAVIGEDLQNQIVSDFKRSSTYQGKDLTATYTPAQLSEKIKAEDFSGLNIGDYFDITLTNNEEARIEVSGFNTNIMQGDDVLINAHSHITMTFRDCLETTYQMNPTNTNTGGYGASALANMVNTTIFNLLPPEWKAIVMPTRRLEPNKGTMATTTRNMWLLSEGEVFGYSSWGEVKNAGNMIQLPIFVGSSRHIVKGLGKGAAESGSQYTWWLSNPLNDGNTHFCTSGGGVKIGEAVASTPLGVAPAFNIC